MSGKILLSEMIQTLRTELEQSEFNASNSNFKFLVDSVELELSVELSKSGEGNTGIKFWVIEAGGKYQQENVSTHKFTLVLKPVTADGAPVQVSNSSVLKTSRK